MPELRGPVVARHRPRSLVAVSCLALAAISILSLRAPRVRGAQDRGGRAEEVVARGLRHIRVLRGSTSVVVRYRVVVGSFDSQALADTMLARLEGAGFSAGPHYRGSRYRISVDALTTQEEAEATKAFLEAAGFPSGLSIEEYDQDVTHAGGPWEIHVLEASPETVRVEVAHAYDAAIGLETTSGLARRRGATAAVNGGYYLRTGILQGDALGVLQLNGTLVSEPDRGRAALGIIETETKTQFLFGRLRFRGELLFEDGTRAILHGLNRRRATGEIILYTPEFHRTTLTPPGGIEVIVVDNRILEIREGQGSAVIPPTGLVVSLSPPRASELRSSLQAGAGLTPTLSLLPAEASEPDPSAQWNQAGSIIGGGPLLLHEGRRMEDPEAESISRVFFLSRHPRTGVGVRGDGTLLFVTVDGRQPLKSVGMSLPELTNLFVELGAVSAVNLDGGGSTAMVVRDRVVNFPSDPTGERPSADAILIFSRDPSS
ncbi:MAG TPA: phosphodiester glycosidase family protein [Vicinamibacteria bacterium]